MNQQSFILRLGKEDRVIRGEVFASTEQIASPTIVICHGFKGFKDWGFFPYAATALAKHGFTVITFNFSMNGVGEELFHFTELDKFARNTYSREQEDLSFLIRSLRERALPFADAIDPKRLGLIGHSRGGGNGLLYAMEDPAVCSVATWNGIADVDLFSPELKEQMRTHGAAIVPNARTGQQMPIQKEVLDDIEANHKRFNIIKRLSSFNRPLLLLQGEQDRERLVEGARKMSQVAPNATLHMISEANHTFGAVHPFQGTTPSLETALEKTAHFFKQTLS